MLPSTEKATQEGGLLIDDLRQGEGQPRKPQQERYVEGKRVKECLLCQGPLSGGRVKKNSGGDFGLEGSSRGRPLSREKKTEKEVRSSNLNALKTIKETTLVG